MTTLRTLLAITVIALPHFALGGGLKLRRSFPDIKRTGMIKVSAQRYVQLGVEWERSNPKRPIPHYQLFDLLERVLVDVPIPTIDMPQSHKDVLGRDQPMYEWGLRVMTSAAAHR